MTKTPSFQLSQQRGEDIPDGLLAFLRDQRGRDVEIDLQAITALSGRQIELILSGFQQWDADGLSFCLIRASEPLKSRVSEIDFPMHLFPEGN